MKYLIVGLGNIGEKYNYTRHNIGFTVLNSFAKEFSIAFQKEKLAEIARLRQDDVELVLIKPSTFMNLSGTAVAYYVQKEKIKLSQLLILTDDLALPFAKMRFREKGSAGGHNGLKSIQACLQTDVYPRLKIGIGNSFAKGEQADFVLSPFSDTEQKEMPLLLAAAKERIHKFIILGLSASMNLYNH